MVVAADSCLEDVHPEDVPSLEASVQEGAYALEAVCILGAASSGSHKQAGSPNQGKGHGNHGKRL